MHEEILHTVLTIRLGLVNAFCYCFDFVHQLENILKILSTINGFT